ncbi:hypothetical protein C922_05548, partial [Plasmodium inui San Antonio 1]
QKDDYHIYKKKLKICYIICDLNDWLLIGATSKTVGCPRELGPTEVGTPRYNNNDQENYELNYINPRKTEQRISSWPPKKQQATTTSIEKETLSNIQVAIHRIHRIKISSKFSSETGSIATYDIQIIGAVDNIITKNGFQKEMTDSDERRVQLQEKSTQEQIRCWREVGRQNTKSSNYQLGKYRNKRRKPREHNQKPRRSKKESKE